MLTITNDDNYLLQIVQLDEVKPHPNADRLQIWNVNGYDVISDMSRKKGDVCVFFPVECKIDSFLLKNLNLYSNSLLNNDANTVGYISESGRVKAIRLRGIVSDGMLIDAQSVFNCYNVQPNFSIGQKFDTIDGVLVSEKFVPKITVSGESNKSKAPKKKKTVIVGFNFHYDTSKLQDNIHKFMNGDPIVITDKWHGTSAVFANLLVEKNLSIWSKIKKFLGFDVVTSEYQKLWASRTVLKGIEEVHVHDKPGFYKEDIWKVVFEEVKHALLPGITIYGEIVGYLPSGKLIQKDYDYGCKPGEHKFLVYRITCMTDHIHEYSWEDVKDYCKNYNLEHVKELFIGNIGDTKDTLQILKDTYLEKQCTYCKNKVPAEGICIRTDLGDKKWYKLKSKAFLEKETKDLDTATEVLE